MMTLLRPLAGLALIANHFAATQEGVAPWRHPEVVGVMCDDVAGSAVRIGPNTFVSVAHVTHNKGCTINGEPFRQVAQKGDFVVLSYGLPDPHWFAHTCAGYVQGRLYTAIGFAHALTTMTEVDMEGTGEKDGQMSYLQAVFTVIPGMSGGAIVDSETGELVGVVNTFDPDHGVSGSVALADTPVCRHA